MQTSTEIRWISTTNSDAGDYTCVAVFASVTITSDTATLSVSGELVLLLKEDWEMLVVSWSSS